MRAREKVTLTLIESVRQIYITTLENHLTQVPPDALYGTNDAMGTPCRRLCFAGAQTIDCMKQNNRLYKPKQLNCLSQYNGMAYRPVREG